MSGQRHEAWCAAPATSCVCPVENSELCQRFTLGAFEGGWRAICLDCDWSQAAASGEDGTVQDKATALGYAHIGQEVPDA